MKKFDEKLVKNGISLLLSGMGINWKKDPNFKETPDRVTRAFKEMNLGLYEDFNNFKVFPSKYNGIVSFKEIRAVGICPHHLLPIEFKISFAYIPKGKVLGLSKIPRLIKRLCARPILQEDLTKDIVDYFKKKVDPLGIAIVVYGVHGCMKFRGVQEAEGVKTAELYGAFFTKPHAKEEFYQLINQK